MRLTILAAGSRMPRWVVDGSQEYAARLKGPGRGESRGDYKLEIREIALGTRTGGDVGKAIKKEGERMLAAIPSGSYVVALQVGGKALSSADLARFLAARARDGRDVVFCIGGPDGLAPEVDARADFKWSLSALTLPHGLARVMVAEALYRAVSILKGHPYHRE